MAEAGTKEGVGKGRQGKRWFCLIRWKQNRISWLIGLALSATLLGNIIRLGGCPTSSSAYAACQRPLFFAGRDQEGCSSGSESQTAAPEAAQCGEKARGSFEKEVRPSFYQEGQLGDMEAKHQSSRCTRSREIREGDFRDREGNCQFDGRTRDGTRETSEWSECWDGGHAEHRFRRRLGLVHGTDRRQWHAPEDAVRWADSWWRTWVGWTTRSSTQWWLYWNWECCGINATYRSETGYLCHAIRPTLDCYQSGSIHEVDGTGQDGDTVCTRSDGNGTQSIEDLPFWSSQPDEALREAPRSQGTSRTLFPDCSTHQGQTSRGAPRASGGGIEQGRGDRECGHLVLEEQNQNQTCNRQGVNVHSWFDSLSQKGTHDLSASFSNICDLVSSLFSLSVLFSAFEGIHYYMIVKNFGIGWLSSTWIGVSDGLEKCLLFRRRLEGLQDFRILIESMVGFILYHAAIVLLLVAIACLVVLAILWLQPRIETRRSLCKVKRVRRCQVRRIFPEQYKKFFFLFLLTFDPHVSSCFEGAFAHSHDDLPETNMMHDGGLDRVAPFVGTRTIRVFWAHGPMKNFQVDLSTPRWQDRAAVGDAFEIQQISPFWDNFALHTVIPLPHDTDPFAAQYILELPGDKNWRASIILLETYFSDIGNRFSQAVIELPMYLTREQLLEEVGLSQACNEEQNFCVVMLLGEVWRQNQAEAKVIPDGAHIKVLCDFSREELMSKTNEEPGSESLVTEIGFPEALGEASDENCLMQMTPTSSVDQSLLRTVEDPLFRLLHDRRHFLGLDFTRPTVISVWKIPWGAARSSSEYRVGLWYQITSWTSCAVRDLDERDESLWHFHLVSPFPTSQRLASNRVHLIGEESKLLSLRMTLLADMWFSLSPTRVVLQYHSGENLIGVLRDAYPGMTFTEGELLWESPDGLVVFDLLDILFLPQGAYVDIVFGDNCEQDNEATSFLTLTSAEAEVCADIGRERQDEIAHYFEIARQWLQPALEQALATVRFYLQNQITARIQALALEGMDRIVLVQYGLQRHHVGTRDRSLLTTELLQPRFLALHIKETWRDLVGAEANIACSFVFPQPSGRIGHLHLLVDLAPVFGGVPILFEKSFLDLQYDYVSSLISFRSDGRISEQIAWGALMLDDFCSFAECRLSSNGVEVMAPQIVDTFFGQLWNIVADRDFDDINAERDSLNNTSLSDEELDDDDFSSFMQSGRIHFHDSDIRTALANYHRTGTRVAVWFLSVAASTWVSRRPKFEEVRRILSPDFLLGTSSMGCKRSSGSSFCLRETYSSQSRAHGRATHHRISVLGIWICASFDWCYSIWLCFQGCLVDRNYCVGNWSGGTIWSVIWYSPMPPACFLLCSFTWGWIWLSWFAAHLAWWPHFPFTNWPSWIGAWQWIDTNIHCWQVIALFDRWWRWMVWWWRFFFIDSPYEVHEPQFKNWSLGSLVTSIQLVVRYRPNEHHFWSTAASRKYQCQHFVLC